MRYLVSGLIVGVTLGWLLDWLLSREEMRSLRETSAVKDAEIDRLKTVLAAAEARIPEARVAAPVVLAEAEWRDPLTGEPVEAYCVKCRTKRTIAGPRRVSLSNGRPAVKGTCPVCRSALFRIVKS